MKTHYSIQQYSMISKEGRANFMTHTFMFEYKLLALSISSRLTFSETRQAQKYNKCYNCEYLQN